MNPLKQYRLKIDRLDAQIVRALNERAHIALRIGLLKAQQGQQVFSPDREQEVLRRVLGENAGPFTAAMLQGVYREILSSTLALQHPLRVAYLGPADTFTHLAALKQFGAQMDYLSCDSITEVFNEVEQGRSDYGVVPIENSIEGAVNHTLDMFMDAQVLICAEILLEISHTLMSQAPLSRIQRVYSNPQVFGQCRRWLERRLPHAEQVEMSSTSQAAARAARERNAAAIGTELAAQRYKLRILARSIEDAAHNVTRFLVIGREPVAPSRCDKTSIVFAVKDHVGALHESLSAFKRERINLTKIESRPSKRRAWEYYFFADLEGHAQSRRVQRALAALERHCTLLKVLGSYPCQS